MIILTDRERSHIMAHLTIGNRDLSWSKLLGVVVAGMQSSANSNEQRLARALHEVITAHLRTGVLPDGGGMG